MLRKNPFIISEYYHIYNRGTDKRVIFTCKRDYNRFLILLQLCNNISPVNINQEVRKGRSFSELFEIEKEDALVDVVSYCLMPNHFHLLIYEKKENGISEFMKKLSTAYSMFFNKKYNRTGGLFEGRFKSKHVNDDAYFRWLFSYIHLNPVKLIAPDWKDGGMPNLQKLQKYITEYKYSSYYDYFVDERIESDILNKDILPDYFSSPDGLKDLINDFKSI